MSKAEQIASFDPNGVGVKGSLFGLPYTMDTAELVVIPVLWDVTTSYSAGTSQGPRAILEASSQVDLAELDIAGAWQLGVAMSDIPDTNLNKELRSKAETYLDWLEQGGPTSEEVDMHALLEEINTACEKLMHETEQQSKAWIEKGKLTVLLGGDHSTPLGHMKACGNHYGDFGILQIDAHADLRHAYEGFSYSHASIMKNALEIPQVSKLVQVGVRDFCQEEEEVIQNSHGHIKTFFDQDMKEASYAGKRWRDQCNEIVDELPEQVYVSFDIDGLDPRFCPNTGTPVPGGMDFDQVMFLIKQVVKSGRRVIGADLCEVAPGQDEFDANVGARVLYRLINLMAVSFGKLSFKD